MLGWVGAQWCTLLLSEHLYAFCSTSIPFWCVNVVAAAVVTIAIVAAIKPLALIVSIALVFIFQKCASVKVVARGSVI